MKSIDHRSAARALLRRAAATLLLVFALVGCAVVTAADGTGAKPAKAKAAVVPAQMSDPLFGISYDTNTIRFERLPAALARKAELSKDLPQWIYARSESAAGTYYIVSGFLRVESDDPAQPGSTVEADFGAVLRQNGDEVEVLCVPDLLFDKDSPVPAAQLQPLLADAVKRYVAAWGGKPALQAALREIKQQDVVPVALHEALRAQDLQVGDAGAR
ncbi:MAG TPA: hypothetical protein VN153_03160 [Tahibacter sp.]|nr:hypothetical protein [Tahibacter sp.]